MDKFEHGGYAREDTGPGGQPESHPLERYFAMPAGGWPEPSTEKTGVPPEPRVPAGPPAGTSPPPAMDPESVAQPQPATTTPPSETAAPRGRLRVAVVSLAIVLIAGGVIGGIVSTTAGRPTRLAPGSPRRTSSSPRRRRRSTSTPPTSISAGRSLLQANPYRCKERERSTSILKPSMPTFQWLSGRTPWWSTIS